MTLRSRPRLWSLRRLVTAILATIGLATLLILFAPARRVTAVDLSVIVTNVQTDVGNKPSVSYDVKNIGDKPISAWTVKLEQRYANGFQVSGSNTTDTFPSADLTGKRPRGEDVGHLLPGETRSYRSTLGKHYGEPPVVIDVQVSMDVFDDGTSVGDDKGADRVFEDRAREAQEMEHWINVLKTELRNHVPQMAQMSEGAIANTSLAALSDVAPADQEKTALADIAERLKMPRDGEVSQSIRTNLKGLIENALRVAETDTTHPDDVVLKQLMTYLDIKYQNAKRAAQRTGKGAK